MKEYVIWNETISNMLINKKTKLRNIEKILKFTVGLISGNTLYKSASTQWKANTSDYVLKYDNNINVEYTNISLTCLAKGDSMRIHNTSGIYDPIKYIWYGKGGTINWDRAGYNKDSVYAELNSYKIDMKKSIYSADSVKFTNKYFFDYKLVGTIDNKVVIAKILIVLLIQDLLHIMLDLR